MFIAFGLVEMAPGMSSVRLAKLRPLSGIELTVSAVSDVAGLRRFGLQNRRDVA